MCIILNQCTFRGKYYQVMHVSVYEYAISDRGEFSELHVWLAHGIPLYSSKCNEPPNLIK